MKRWHAWVVAVVAGMTAAVVSHAHDPGISSAEVTLRADRVDVTTGFAPADAEQLVAPELRSSGRLTEADFLRGRQQLEAIAPRMWEVRTESAALLPGETGVEWIAEDNVTFRATYPLPDDAKQVTLRATRLGELPSGHRQFVIVSDERGNARAKKLLRANDSAIVVELPTLGATSAAPDWGETAGRAINQSAPTAPTFWGFVWLGMEHIWIGYDHLLFLFALLVVCRSFRSIVGIITCFTLAHSLTLALAALEVVTLPSAFVEVAIAASIVFVGVENLIRRDREPPGRWALTFAFGLIHGFGFASVLRDLGVGGGGSGIALPLFTFNLGVEIGQIAIAAVVLPIVWQLRKNEKFVRVGVPVLSAVVAAAGLYWLVERLR